LVSNPDVSGVCTPNHYPTDIHVHLITTQLIFIGRVHWHYPW